MIAQIVQDKANVAADTEHIKFILNKGNSPNCLFENT